MFWFTDVRTYVTHGSLIFCTSMHSRFVFVFAEFIVGDSHTV